MKKTNWYVITGGPGAGKTTMVNLLSSKGYTVTIEHARHYIDTMLITGKTVEEIRSHQREFQLRVLKMQMKEEARLSPEDIVFLDRAIPDSLAYYRFLNLVPDEKLLDALKCFSYKRIFILDLLPLVQDYARREDEAEQRRLHSLLINAYEELGFDIVHVPVMPPEQRVQYILNHLENKR